MSGNEYVVCNRAAKTFGSNASQFEALRDVNFSVGNREFVSLLGPSGCGKTTLLMMVGGLESVTRGRITVGGMEIDGPRADSAIMFQDATLLAWKTALENVLFPVSIRRLSTAAYKDRAEELLKIVGLAGFGCKKPLELSGGMRQRVALCRALIQEPSLLLMDEPFSALDAITRDEMNMVLTETWANYQCAVLFVTHSIREAVILSDRVIVLGRKPSTIISDIKIELSRPRDLALNETAEFNEICGHLREMIQHAHLARQPID